MKILVNVHFLVGILVALQFSSLSQAGMIGHDKPEFLEDIQEPCSGPKAQKIYNFLNENSVKYETKVTSVVDPSQNKILNELSSSVAKVKCYQIVTISANQIESVCQFENQYCDGFIKNKIDKN